MFKINIYTNLISLRGQNRFPSGLLDKIFGSKNQKVLKKIQPLVNSINSLEETFSLLSDQDLKEKKNRFHQPL